MKNVLGLIVLVGLLGASLVGCNQAEETTGPVDKSNAVDAKVEGAAGDGMSAVPAKE